MLGMTELSRPMDNCLGYFKTITKTGLHAIEHDALLASCKILTPTAELLFFLFKEYKNLRQAGTVILCLTIEDLCQQVEEYILKPSEGTVVVKFLRGLKPNIARLVQMLHLMDGGRLLSKGQGIDF